MATWQAASSPEESGRRPHGDPAAAGASPPVLLLSHFCTVPFLCFGDVRVGASRTRSLVLHNPHEEPLQVELSLVRAAGQGFSVSSNRCELKVGARGVAPWRGPGFSRHVPGDPGTPTPSPLPVLIPGRPLCTVELGLNRTSVGRESWGLEEGETGILLQR